MPRNASGTYTLPAGNPVVTGTTIASSWANTTLDDLKTEVTDSLSRSAKGGMLGQLALVDGTAGAPGLAFSNELSTGLYRPSANQLGFAVAGAGQLIIRAVSAALVHNSPLAAADAGDDAVFSTNVVRTAGNLFTLRTGGAARLRVNFLGELALANSGAITTFDTANLGITLRGNKNAADGGADLTVNSFATRTGGSLFVVQNNSSGRFRVDSDGTLVSPTGSSGNFIFDQAGTVRINGTNSHLTLMGNKSAADAGTDVVLTSTATRTAGFLSDVQNNGSSKFKVKFDGTVHMPDIAAIAATGTNATFTLYGNRNAADAGSDVLVNSQVTRTAGSLLHVANNGVEKFLLDFNGEIVTRAGFACGTAFKTDADQVESAGVATNVTGMSFPVVANGVYVWDVIGFTNNNTSTDLLFTGPAAPTSVRYGRTDFGVVSTAFGGVITSSTSGERSCLLAGTLVNGANAGTVQLQFKWSSVGTNATFKKGAQLRWRRIA